MRKILKVPLLKGQEGSFPTRFQPVASQGVLLLLSWQAGLQLMPFLAFQTLPLCQDLQEPLLIHLAAGLCGTMALHIVSGGRALWGHSSHHCFAGRGIKENSR